jgi:hypothetical protein
MRLNNIFNPHNVKSRVNVQKAIRESTPIDDTLHIIIVVSNICEYKKRWILANEFIYRMKDETHIKLYVVELAYGTQKYQVTNPNNPNHLQLCTDIPLWHKENLINIGVRRLLPESWKAMAWIDADIEFDNPHWVQDTLKLLNRTFDVVQLGSHIVDLNQDGTTGYIYSGFGYQYNRNIPYFLSENNSWQAGYAWACKRTAYEQLGGLYESSILGAGDLNISTSIFQNVLTNIPDTLDSEYKRSLLEYEKKAKGLKLGYTPGIIKHHFHGSKEKRHYESRWNILVKHKYNPYTYVKHNSEGILVPTELFPREMILDILNYFKSRDEDEGL